MSSRYIFTCDHCGQENDGWPATKEWLTLHDSNGSVIAHMCPDCQALFLTKKLAVANAR